MNNNSTLGKMNQSIPLATKEALTQTVSRFLERLTEVKWKNLEDGSFDPETKAVLIEMCSEVIDIVAKYLYEIFRDRLKEEKDASPRPSSAQSEESKKSHSVSEEEVQEFLGNMGDLLTQTVAKVKGVTNLFYDGTQKMTELMVTAVTKRVNSKLSKNSDEEDTEGAKTCPGVLKKLGKHFKKILKKCASSMPKISTKRRAQQDESPLDEEEEETVDKCQEAQEQEFIEITEPSSTSLQEDTVSSVESLDSKFMSVIRAAKDILQDHENKIALSDLSRYISEEEIGQLISQTSKETEELAFEIVECLTSEIQQEQAAASDKESAKKAAKTKKFTKKMICSRIKAIFVREFALGSILNRANKLRNRQSSSGSPVKKTSSELLINSVDALIRDLITQVEQDKKSDSKDLYEKIASNISDNGLKSFTERLSETLTDHLTLGEGQEKLPVEEISHEVESFMKRMWTWVRQQVQQHKKKGDRVTMALKEIKKLVISELKQACAPKNESKTLKPEPKEDPHVGPEPEQEEDQRSLDFEVWNQTSYKPEEDNISLKVEVWRVVLDETESRVSTAQWWDRVTCEVIVTELCRQLLKDVAISQSHSAYKQAIDTLTDLLWEQVKNHSVEVDLSAKNLKKICKAVRKKLVKKFGTSELWRRLLTQCGKVNEAAIRALKKNLFPKKTSGIKSFFQHVFKPFTALF